jgi:hypothetical protein
MTKMSVKVQRRIAKEGESAAVAGLIRQSKREIGVPGKANSWSCVSKVETILAP